MAAVPLFFLLQKSQEHKRKYSMKNRDTKNAGKKRKQREKAKKKGKDPEDYNSGSGIVLHCTKSLARRLV